MGQTYQVLRQSQYGIIILFQRYSHTHCFFFFDNLLYDTVMTPFHNKGWKYFNQFQEIMLGSTARGSHAFLPATCAPPGQRFGDEDDEESNGGASISRTTGLNKGPMDIDKEIDGSASISASGSKCELATITSEGDTVAPLCYQMSLPGRNLLVQHCLLFHLPNCVPKCHPPIALKCFLLSILQVVLVLLQKSHLNLSFTKYRDQVTPSSLLSVILCQLTQSPKSDRMLCACCKPEMMDSQRIKKS